LLLLALAACGQMGPLYLPDTTRGEIVTRPTQTPGETSNSPAPPDSPAPEAATDKKKQNGNPPPK
jgi:predicted small lipoprotein YifL